MVGMQEECLVTKGFGANNAANGTVLAISVCQLGGPRVARYSNRHFLGVSVGAFGMRLTLQSVGSVKQIALLSVSGPHPVR